MLIVRNPRSSFDNLDRVFDQLTSNWFAGGHTRSPMPHVQAEWDAETLVLTVDLPGVPRDAVSVDVADSTLTIGVEHSTDRGDLSWTRTLQLGGSLDTGAITARYADGRLVVTVPPAAKAEPRRIEIETAGEPTSPAIEAEVTPES